MAAATARARATAPIRSQAVCAAPRVATGSSPTCPRAVSASATSIAAPSASASSWARRAGAGLRVAYVSASPARTAFTGAAGSCSARAAAAKVATSGSPHANAVCAIRCSTSGSAVRYTLRPRADLRWPGSVDHVGKLADLAGDTEAAQQLHAQRGDGPGQDSRKRGHLVGPDVRGDGERFRPVPPEPVAHDLGEPPERLGQQRSRVIAGLLGSGEVRARLA